MASDQPGENTRAVHLPPAPVPAQQPLGTPVYRTAAFAFASSAEYAALLNGEAAGYSYSRIDNPTADAFAIAVAALEGQRLDGPTAAQAFASGMSAISTVFWTFAGAGGHVVASAAVYGGTYGFLRDVASRFGVQTDFVDVTDTDQVRAAMRPETQIVYAETVANPTTAVADLPALAEIAHAPRGAAGGGLHHGAAGDLPAAGARGRPGAALRHQVPGRSLGHDRRSGVRGAWPDQPGPRGAHRHRRGPGPRRGIPAPPGAGDAAVAGRTPVLDRDALRRRGGPASCGPPRGLPGPARASGASDGDPAVRRGAGGHPVRRHRHGDPAGRPAGRVPSSPTGCGSAR